MTKRISTTQTSRSIVQRSNPAGHHTAIIAKETCWFCDEELPMGRKLCDRGYLEFRAGAGSAIMGGIAPVDGLACGLTGAHGRPASEQRRDGSAGVRAGSERQAQREIRRARRTKMTAKQPIVALKATKRGAIFCDHDDVHAGGDGTIIKLPLRFFIAFAQLNIINLFAQDVAVAATQRNHAMPTRMRRPPMPSIPTTANRDRAARAPSAARTIATTAVPARQ